MRKDVHRAGWRGAVLLGGALVSVSVAACSREVPPDAASATTESAQTSVSVGLYHSDNCQSDLLAALGPQTDCVALAAAARQSVWAVKIGGTCSDISDTSFLAACTRFKAASDPDAVGLLHSDQCNGNLLAYAGPSTDCAAMASVVSDTVWGVSRKGQCEDVQDMPFQTACEKYRGQGPGTTGVTLYHSDRCNDGDRIGEVGPKSNCATVATVVTQSVWAVKVDGQCLDISDTTALSACQRFKAGGENGVALHHSDTCTSDLLAYVGPSSNCAEMASTVSSTVWGVRRDGVCDDISDVPFQDACHRFKDGGGAGAQGTALFHSDSCASDMIATIGPTTDCAALAGQSSQTVWGVRVNGKCSDVSDTTVLDACTRFKAAAENGIALYRSDQCTNNLLAYVGPSSSCSAMAASISDAVWGVSVGDQCSDISDSSFQNACLRYQAGTGTTTQGAALYHSDQCTGDLVAVVGPQTDCAALATVANQSIWGVRLGNGDCVDISDTSLVDACARFKAGN